MSKFILSFDQGTTSSRAIVFNKEGSIVSIAQKEFEQIYPQPGWVEHNASEIWSTQIAVATEAIVKASLTPPDIAAIGITNQRETTVLWDKKTGEPLYNAIVWQDRRTSAYCDELKSKGLAKKIQEKTGLILDAYFSATKIKWILDNVEGARAKAEAGDIAFGTIDSWLIWKLTDGRVHVTDVSNASRTMIYNIHTLDWDQELLDLFDIPKNILPEVKSSSEVYGETTGNVLAAKIPIAGIAGDQQAALFGQMCTEVGMVKNTYGTGCFMLMNIGDKPIVSQNNLVTTIAWKINGKVQYALEGSIFIGGAVVQWLRDGLGIISSSAEVETLALKVADTGGVYLVPAFAGLGAPHWNQDARGTITGITRGTTAAHLARAAIESIAFQTMEVLKAMEADSGHAIKELRVDGGATSNDILMQFQADLLDTTVIRPKVTEVTALGAAYLAGLAVGYWNSMDDISGQWKIDKNFNAGNTDNIAERIKGWNRAVKAAKANAEN
ncbi:MULTISPECIES: glycerol kinase GlpK [Pedobacter]|uniref:Glycerol kinase n=1 Tax=Pedobacter heparinus (strain ATCC 13125 / DSM 2366 / CIP 104194 / JCM 7457 / NBRC 12017 / NCIMB 9290 / NRRL B-14731 / HIM 762-3) TaxID=485917 RepID=C6XX72_PEDHD|nr:MULTISPECIES: glycerol kinase GlpK [Pedobacter]ACU06378.1 glycerol kinase [Pedobacter heparinus DSM 2366]MBB5437252.1 glycerol kinase [Pedobacter sp. AK017]